LLAFDLRHAILARILADGVVAGVIRSNSDDRTVPDASQARFFQRFPARYLTRMRRMTQAAKAQEPSMEEILASIRRIIADDDATKPPAKAPAKPAEPANALAKAASPPPPPAAPPAAMEQDDIDAMLSGLDPAPAEAAPEPAEEVLELTEAMAAPEPEPATAFRHVDADQDVVFDEAPPPPPPRASEAPLLSNAASAAVHSAFGNLAHTMLVQNARTLEDLVREMLRPMLKTWLDDNLPLMVERLVRAEIERVARGPKA
jgi:cell pole-organizing protein PopZ